MPSEAELSTAFIVMHRDTFLWVFGLLGVAVASLVFKGMAMLRSIVKSSDELVHKHRHPDDYGFGSQALRDSNEHMLRIQKSQARLAHWQAAKLTGKEPPPLDLD